MQNRVDHCRFIIACPLCGSARARCGSACARCGSACPLCGFITGLGSTSFQCCFNVEHWSIAMFVRHLMDVTLCGGCNIDSKLQVTSDFQWSCRLHQPILTLRIIHNAKGTAVQLQFTDGRGTRQQLSLISISLEQIGAMLYWYQWTTYNIVDQYWKNHWKIIYNQNCEYCESKIMFFYQ